jgi:hypothetical protein
MNKATRGMSGYVVRSGCLIPIGMAIHLSLPNGSGVAIVAALWTAALLVLVSLRKVSHAIAATYVYASPADPHEPLPARPRPDDLPHAARRTETGGRWP